MKEVYVFLTDSESIRAKVLSGIVPAGFYDVQNQFNGDQWITVYRLYEFDPELDSPETVGPWIDEFTPQAARVSECGGLSIVVEE